MSNKTDLVEIKLKAKDETHDAFASVKEKIKGLLEKDGVEEAIGGALKFAGGALAVEAVSKSIESLTEVTKKFDEEWEHAWSEEEKDAAIRHIGANIIDQIPIIGSFTTAINEAKNAWRDHAAMLLKEEGASEAVVNAARSQAGYMAYVLSLLQQTKTAYQEETEAIHHWAQARAKANNATAEQIEVQNAALASTAKLTAMRMELEEYKDKHHTPSKGEKNVIALKEEAIAKEAEASGQDAANIRNRYRKQRAEEDRSAGEERAEIAARSNERVEDLQAEWQAQWLRLRHQDTQADLLLLKRQHDREIEENKRLEDQELADAQHKASKLKDERGYLDQGQLDRDMQAISKRRQAERNALSDRYGLDKEKAERDGANAAADQRAEREKAFGQLKLDVLKQEASQGNEEARRAAVMLGLEDKYKAKRDEINKMLRDGRDLSADERKQLEGSLQAMDAIEKAEIESSLNPQGPQTSAFSNAGELGAGNSGRRAGFEASVRQRENDERNLRQKHFEEAVKQTGFLAQAVEEVKALAARLGLPANLAGH